MTSDRKADEKRTWGAEDLDVFQQAYALSLRVHRASLTFPKIEQYSGLADQLRRASKSVCGLIVEGAGRQKASSMEFGRYLTMAIGSAEEAKLWCRYALDLICRRGNGERLARSIRPNPSSVGEAPRERSATYRSLIADNRSPDGSGAFRKLMKGQP